MAKIYTDKAHIKEDMGKLYNNAFSEQNVKEQRIAVGNHGAEKLGHQDKDKMWVHREKKWDIKRKVFMHKMK